MSTTTTTTPTTCPSWCTAQGRYHGPGAGHDGPAWDIQSQDGTVEIGAGTDDLGAPLITLYPSANLAEFTLPQAERLLEALQAAVAWGRYTEGTSEHHDHPPDRLPDLVRPGHPGPALHLRALHRPWDGASQRCGEHHV